MKKNIFKSLGPGLLFAGAAVGVSHLVQSTRAGADFGFGLLWVLLLATVFKYPFFQFGPRYAAATGETLLDGYKKLGKGVLAISYAISFLTMFIIQAAVTIVTAGLAINIFGTFDLFTWSVLITISSMIILLVGKYKLLDGLMKYVILLLTICTLFAVTAALLKNNQAFSFEQVIPKGTIEITFLIAFLGWMPTSLDISIWQSIWSVEKEKISHQKITPKQAIFDFNVGYIGTIFLAACFLILGALVMHNSEQSFSNKGGVFAGQLIELYTKNLGNFAYIFIATAALTTMFSTTITALDASPRAMSKSNELLFPAKIKLNYWFWIVVLSLGTFIILKYFSDNMGLMVKIGTILSFLTAPFYAILNYILITGKHTPKEHRPSIYLKILSICGIIFLVGFSAWFLLNL